MSTDTLVDLLRARALRSPERTALIFLGDEPDPVTNADLDRDARAMATALLAHAAPGDRVLLLLPPGRGYVTAFLGCLYAGLVAVPQYPPTARQGGGTVLATARDAGIAVAVADRTGIGAVAENHPELAALPNAWVCPDDVPAADGSWPGPRPEDLALLQYTSGSTGTPKGVMVRHANLMHNSASIAQAIGAGPDSRSVSWLPPYHDMGLIGGIIQPLYSGFTGILLTPTSFLRNPLRWLKAISDYRADVSPAPDFGYLECVRRIPAEAAVGLDLSCWKHALVGAEPVRPSTLEAFADRFAAQGFRWSAFHPCYGLAEATLFVTGDVQPPHVISVDRAALSTGTVTVTGAESAAKLTGCGRTVGPDRVVIADPVSGQPKPDGEVGEILIAGPTVTGGYWGHAEGFGEFLHTGDLGFQLDGDLFITGRAKDLIIVGGRNLSPHELETTGEAAHPAVLPGRSAAFSVDVGGAERVVLVHEVRRDLSVEDTRAVIDAVTGAITTEHSTAPHEVVLVRPGKVPTTSSGKVRRGRCRELWLAGELPALRQAARRVEGVSPEVAELLSWTIPAPDVPLVALGLDSLRAVRLAGDLQDAFGAAPEMSDLLGDLTPRGLTAWAATARPAALTDPPLPTGRATSAQEWLWLLDRAGAGPAYTILGGLRLHGSLDETRLIEAASAVLGEYPALRTTFAMRDDVLVTTVGENTVVPVPVLHAPDPEEASRLIRDLATEGFDLAAGPLLRAVLVRVGGQDWVLGIAVHHIAVDGWSMALLLNEVGRRYRGEPAKPLPTGVPATREDNGFWRDTLRGARAVSLGSGHRGWDGVAGDLEVPVELAARIRDYAARQHATPFMVLLSALAVVLAHRTGQTDLVIGTPAAGRDVGNANATGLFVNTLPIRIDVSGQPDFATLLGRVRTACLGAYAHQQVPFERVLRAAGAPSSLVGVCLSFQNLPFAPWQQDGLSAEPFELPVPGAQFELTVTLAQQPDGSLRGHTVHAADLVDAETIATLRTELVAVLEAGTSGVGHPLPLPAAAPFELVPLSVPEPFTMVGPRDEVEATLAGIWCEVIDLPEVSVTAPFFELGGHSLQAARILARVESAFGVRVPVAELLTTGTTIEHLATIVRAAADPEVDDAVAALAQLSDEEIADLLQGGRA